MRFKSILVIALVFSQLQFFAQKLKWHTDYEEAKKIAKKSNKKLLLDFTGSDWCGYCIRLRKDVFEDPKFKKWANDKLVLVELEFPRKKILPNKLKQQNQMLLKKFKVRGFPTLFFLTSEEKVLGSMSGYRDLNAWIKEADGIIK